MAAPVVGKMFSDVLPYMGIEPEFSDEEQKTIDRAVPDVVGLSISDAEEKLSGEDFEYRILGNGSTITDQLPTSGAVIAEGSTVIIYADRVPTSENEIMPDISGMSYSEANEILSTYGLFIRSSALIPEPDELEISTQSVKCGNKVKPGTVIEVTLLTSDDSMLGRY